MAWHEFCDVCHVFFRGLLRVLRVGDDVDAIDVNALADGLRRELGCEVTVTSATLADLADHGADAAVALCLAGPSVDSVVAWADRARVPVIAVVDEADPAALAAAFGSGARDCVAARDTARLLHACARELRWRREREALSCADPAFGAFARRAAHDVNNYLGVIVALATAIHDHGPATTAEDARAILHAAAHAGTLSAYITRRGHDGSPKAHDARRSLRAMRSLVRTLLGGDTSLAWELDPRRLPVAASPIQLEQIVINLALNARDAAAKSVRISSARVVIDEALAGQWQPAPPPGAYLELSLGDDGSGMDDETRTRAFQPFFTTKGDSGTGLGMATIMTITRDLGGSVALESSPSAGTTVKVLLPLLDDAALDEAQSETSAASSAGTRRAWWYS